MWFLLPLLVCLTGCITIEENYTFKKDGSGTMEYVIDMTEMFKLLNDMPMDKTDSKGGMKLADKLDGLKAVKGIGKVKVKEEKKGAIQRVSFRFDDLTALNHALDVLMPDSSGTQHERFKWDGTTLVRTNTAFASELGASMASDPSDTTGALMLLQSMHYKYSFKFANEIGEMQQAEGITKESIGSKEVKLSTDFSVIAKDPKALDLRISLK